MMWVYILLAFIWVFQYFYFIDEMLASIFKKQKYTLQIEIIGEHAQLRKDLGMYTKYDIPAFSFMQYKYMTNAAATFNMIYMNLIANGCRFFMKEEVDFIYTVKRLENA